MNNKVSATYKNEILKCAQKIIGTDGMKGLSIGRVAKECKISKTTFYVCFSSKDELIRCLQSNIRNDTELYSTRERIIEKAITHFSSNSYNEIDLETIARSAGIKRSSIYRYFSNKEELLEAVIYNELKNREKLVARLKKEVGDPLTFFEKYIEYFNSYANNKYTSLLYATCIYYSKKNSRIKECFDNLREYTVKAFAESFEMGKTTGVFKENFDSKIYAKIFFSVMAGINIHSPVDFVNVAQNYLNLLYSEIKVK